MKNKRIYKQINILSDVELAYIAGIIDGEGTLTINKKKDKTMTGVSNGLCLRPSLSVVNTNFELLEWLVEKTGLGKLTSLRNGKSKKHKPYKRWNVWSKQAQQIVIKVLPFLIVKKTQADVWLKFVSIQKRKKNLLQSEWDLQFSCYEKIKILNKRGLDEE